MYASSTILYFGNINNATPSFTHSTIVRNNVLIGTYSAVTGGYTGYGSFTNTTPIKYYGNIFVDVNTGIKVGSSRSNGNVDIYNNTFVNIQAKNVIDTSSNMYNNIISTTDYTSPIAQENNLILTQVDPDDIFTDYDNEDFSLKDGSAAINAGTWLAFMDDNWTTDLLGGTVTQTDDINIGALQGEVTPVDDDIVLPNPDEPEVIPETPADLPTVDNDEVLAALQKIKENILYIQTVQSLTLSDFTVNAINVGDTGAEVLFKYNTRLTETVDSINDIIVSLSLTSEQLDQALYAAGVTSAAFLTAINNNISAKHDKIVEIVNELNS
jgi:hypothetical protein